MTKLYIGKKLGTDKSRRDYISAKVPEEKGQIILKDFYENEIIKINTENMRKTIIENVTGFYGGDSKIFERKQYNHAEKLEFIPFGEIPREDWVNVLQYHRFSDGIYA